MNQNKYRTSPKVPSYIIIGIISFGLIFGLHLILKSNQIKTIPDHRFDVGYGYEINIIQSLNEISKSLNDLKKANNSSEYEETKISTLTTTQTNHVNMYINYDTIVWLDSPVMQTWTYNEKAKVWETALPYKESFRSSPTLIFGLREDGVVVWKKIK